MELISGCRCQCHRCCVCFVCFKCSTYWSICVIFPLQIGYCITCSCCQCACFNWCCTCHRSYKSCYICTGKVCQCPNSYIDCQLFRCAGYTVFHYIDVTCYICTSSYYTFQSTDISSFKCSSNVTNTVIC